MSNPQMLMVKRLGFDEKRCVQMRWNEWEVQSKATKALLKAMVSFLCFVWFCWECLIFYFERTCVGELLIVKKCPLENELVIDVVFFLSFTKGWLGLKIVNDGFGLDWCSKSFDWGANSPCCRLHRVQFSNFPLCHWCEIVNARCTHTYSVCIQPANLTWKS